MIITYYDINLKYGNSETLEKEDSFTFYKIDLKYKEEINHLFEKYKFDYVINLAAKAGGRYDASIENIFHCLEKEGKILEAIEKINTLECLSISHFGESNSDQNFLEIIKDEKIWMHEIQKRLMDIDF